jgi:hypothetical protein
VDGQNFCIYRSEQITSSVPPPTGTKSVEASAAGVIASGRAEA